MTSPKDIVAALETSAPATAPELAARLGQHPVTVERECRRLQRTGRLLQVTGGGYVLGDSTASTAGPEPASD